MAVATCGDMHAEDVTDNDGIGRARVDVGMVQVCPGEASLEVDTASRALPAISADGKESVVARYYREYAMRPARRPLIMDILVGPAVSLGSRGGHYDWAGPRPKAINCITLRLGYYPFLHWGIYGSISWSTYKPREYWSDILDVPLIDQSRVDCFYGGTWANASGEYGLAYQVQYRRWAFQARVGYGAYSMGRGGDVKGVYNKVDEFGRGYEPELEVCRHIWTRYVAFSMTFGYRLSRTCNLVFDIGYRHPFDRPDAFVSTFYDERPAGWHYNTMHMPGATGGTKFSSITPWGRDLTLYIGFQFITDMARKPGGKRNRPHTYTPPVFHHRK